MPKFTIPVKFQAVTYYTVEAKTQEKAEEKVKKEIEDGMPLLQEDTEIPGDFEVVSFA